jgi:hypothetical protein
MAAALRSDQLRAAMANGGVIVRLQLDASLRNDKADGRPLNAAISAALTTYNDN